MARKNKGYTDIVISNTPDKMKKDIELVSSKKYGISVSSYLKQVIREKLDNENINHLKNNE